ncbi:T9SS type A sorting domain-containing protein [Flammeovirga pectinis]|uniref:T9SS type A sorting domain-containing protein n=1 Tax=Flammeovirga pectinis TaxID=2494373 RepID=A0A3Q9FMZ1_9BACT|nr:T9SS type A sorting domain-containing protein [Flammeovirga pectinis]AZQ63848.1 T9SS type A sorting domain-containing protein [Flammeovirga pectinis]
MQTLHIKLLFTLCAFQLFTGALTAQTLPTGGLVFNLKSDAGLSVDGSGNITWVEQVKGAVFVSDGSTKLEEVEVKYDGINTDFTAVKFSDNGYLKLESDIEYSDIRRVFVVYKSEFEPLYNNSTDLMMLFGDRYSQVALETRSKVVDAGTGKEYVPYTFSLDGNSEWQPTAKHAINFNTLSEDFQDNTDPRNDAWTKDEWEIVEVEYIDSRNLIQGTHDNSKSSSIELGRLVHNTSMFYQGQIAEVIVYDDSFTEYDELKEYIENKYRIKQRQWYSHNSSSDWTGTNAWSLDSTTLDLGDAPYKYPVTGDKAHVMGGDQVNFTENHINLNELLIDFNGEVNAQSFINHNFHTFKGTGTYKTYVNELPNCDLVEDAAFYLEGGGIFHFSAADLNSNVDVTLEDDLYTTYNFNNLIVNIGAYEFDFVNGVHVYDSLKLYNSTIKISNDFEVDSNFVLYSDSKVIDNGADQELMIRGHFNISDGCEVDIPNTIVRFEGEGSKDAVNTYYQRFQIGGATTVKKVRIERPLLKDQVQIISTDEAYQLNFNPVTPNNGLDGDGNYDASFFQIELVRGRLRFADNIHHELITSTLAGENPVRKISTDMNIWLSGSNQITINSVDKATLLVEDGGNLTVVSSSEFFLENTDLTIQGNLQLGISGGSETNGILSVDGNVSFEGSSSKFNYRSGYLALTGNYYKDTDVTRKTGASNPIIKFTGTSAAIMSAPWSTDDRIGQLVIDKNLGEVKPGLTIQDHEVYANNVILENGLIDANGQLIWDTTTDEKQTETISKDSYIVGKTSFIVDEGGSAYFPIGGVSGFYLAGVGPAPLSDFNRTVNPSAKLITWQAMYVDEAIGGDFPSDLYSDKYEDGMWRINPEQATSSEITLYLENADISNVGGEDKSENLRILTRDNSLLSDDLDWGHEDGIGNPPQEIKKDETPGGSGNLLAIKTELYSFKASEIPSGASGLRVNAGLSNHEFTPGLSINADLPVELISFTTIVKSSNVHILWSTAQELNNEGFIVEKSKDKRNWEEVTFKEGQGSTAVISNYEVIDLNPYVGISYYRLKQVDFDGTQEVFGPQKVVIGTEEITDLMLYPNPSEGITTFQLLNTMEQISITIYSPMGKLIESFSIENAAKNSITYDTSVLPTGVYIVQCVYGKERLIKKLFVR